MSTQVNNSDNLKYRRAFIRFLNSWLLAVFTWPLFFVNFTEKGWEYSLLVTETLAIIPGIIAVLFTSNKKRYYLPVSWVIGLLIAIFWVVYFGMDIFVSD